MADSTLHVELVAADRTVWSGDASMVIARTVEGDVGVLAGHAPMLSLLTDATVEITTPDGGVVAVVDGGFLSQNTYVAKQFTGIEGSTVPVADTIEAFNKIADGEYDHVAEQAFFMCGGLEDVDAKWADIQKNS